jgi:Zn-finger nucleic acid-binding protein
MIYYGCPKCQAPMASPDEMAGQTDTCPECGNVAVVPSADTPLATSRHGVRTLEQQPQVIYIQPQHNGTPYNPTHAGRVVTIEKTAKRLKLHQLLSSLGLAITVVGAIAAAQLDANVAWWALAAAICFAWTVATRISIWWNHG